MSVNQQRGAGLPICDIGEAKRGKTAEGSAGSEAHKRRRARSVNGMSQQGETPIKKKKKGCVLYVLVWVVCIAYPNVIEAINYSINQKPRVDAI